MGRAALVWPPSSITQTVTSIARLTTNLAKLKGAELPKWNLQVKSELSTEWAVRMAKSFA